MKIRINFSKSALTFIVLVLFSWPAAATTFTVTKTADTNDGSCSSSDCSMREALVAANADAGSPHTINFSIPSSGTSRDTNCDEATGVCTIFPTSALPTIARSLVINAFSQPSATENTADFPNALNTAIKLELSGTSSPNGTDGLTVNAANVTIKGLSIHSFPSAAGTYTAHGIQTVNSVGVTGLKVQGCYIGVKADGETVAKNVGNGIYITGSRNTGSVIGSDGDGVNEAAERNLISGNDNYGIWIQGSSTTVSGNFIGVDKDGNTDLGHRWVGVYDASGSNIIGTDGDGVSDATEGNLISGNNTHGIRVATGSNTVIAGNIIGLAADGVTAVKNTGHGIYISSTGTSIRIGSNDDGISDDVEANIVSGNGNGSTYANIYLENSADVVRGNLIGLSADGGSAVTSNAQGIWIKGNNNVVDDNAVSGHRYAGIYTDQGDNNTISANSIGVTSDGVDAGNGYHGISLGNGATNNVLQNNTIAYNGDAANENGIYLGSATDDGNQFLSNSFHDNQDAAIRFIAGANNGKAAPVITGQTVSGTTPNLIGTATAGDSVELYRASSDSEGETSLGTVTADSSGNWSFSLTTLTRGDVLLALATDPTNGTSTFSTSYTFNNQAPIADDVSATTSEDTATAITLTSSDADGDTLSYSIATSPTNGSVVLTDNIATYTPNANYNGTDAFTFTVSDDSTSTAATVTMTITAVNDAPVVNDIAFSTDEDTTATFTFSGTDVDGDPLTYTTVSSPAHGTVTISENSGSLTPTPNENGSDTFTYRAYDGQAYSETKTAILSIIAVNDPPEASPISATSLLGEPVTLEEGGVDPDGDSLTYEFDSGNVTHDGTDYIYTPDTDSTATSDEFSYTVCDSADCVSEIVTITLSPSADIDCLDRVPTSFENLDVLIGNISYLRNNGSRSHYAKRVRVNITFYNGVTDSEREVTTSTDDSGCYFATYDEQEEEVRQVDYYALSSSTDTRADGSSQSAPDGVSPDYCNGADWEFRSLDETATNEWNVASYSSSSVLVAGLATDYRLYERGRINISIDSFSYIYHTIDDTNSIAFHALDVALTTMELVCSAESTASFGTLYLDEDISNICQNEQYGCYDSNTRTIEYGHNDIASIGSSLTFTIAHEFGHFLQNQFYTKRDLLILAGRLSSLSHNIDDLEDPRMAFSEGFSNGLGDYITEQYWDSPYYDLGTLVDPGAGIAMESNVGYVFYQLINDDGYATIHDVYKLDMPTTPVFQTLHSFGYYYAQQGGSVSPFESIGLPSASLNDLYDNDNVIGQNLGSFYALYPRINYEPPSPYYPLATAESEYGEDYTGDGMRWYYVDYIVNQPRQDCSTLTYLTGYCYNFITGTENNYDGMEVWRFMYERDSDLSLDMTPMHTVAEHDVINHDSAGSDAGAGTSRWFTVDGNQFRHHCYPDPDYDYAYFRDGFCSLSGDYEKTVNLEISDDSDSGRCTVDLTLIAYKDGNIYNSASGYCPSVDVSADGTYIIEVYATDGVTDVPCFSFMDEHYCEDNL